MDCVTRVKQSRLDLLDALPKGLVIAELGVFCGDFSQEILRRCEPRMLYLVDTFEGRVMSGDQNGENLRSIDMSDMRWEIERRFASNSVHVVRSDSIAWLNDQDSNSLDIVYIDTTHSYARTVSELESSRRVVGNGGFICGHDYSTQYPGVIEAVSEFIECYGFQIFIYDLDKLPSYRIDKPSVASR